MSRFVLSDHALEDLEGVISYLNGLPNEPALRIGYQLRNALHRLAAHPNQGFVQQDLSTQSGKEIRCFVEDDYIIYYDAKSTPVEFQGMIHGKRDVQTIMRNRLG